MNQSERENLLSLNKTDEDNFQKFNAELRSKYTNDDFMERAKCRIQNAKFIFTNIENLSLTNILKYRVAPLKYDICIILDASTAQEYMMTQILELNIPKLVLVGDSDCRTPGARKEKGNDSLMHRLLRNRSQNVFSLDAQWRMHPEIFEFTKQYCYPSLQMVLKRSSCSFGLASYLIFDLSLECNSNQNSTLELLHLDFMKRIVKYIMPLLNIYHYRCCIFTSEPLKR